MVRKFSANKKALSIRQHLLVTSKNRFEKGKWVECAECEESLLVRLYALRGGFLKQSVCYTHFHSNKVFRGDLLLFHVCFIQQEPNRHQAFCP